MADGAVKEFLQQHSHLMGLKTAAIRPGVSLRPHQQEAVEETVESPDGMLLYHQTGTGKGLSSLAAAEQLDQAVNVLAPAALRNNYNKEINKFTDSPERYAVNSYERAGKGDLPSRPTLVLDEVQRLRNQGKAYQGTLEAAMAAKKRILLSATPVVNSPGDLAAVINLLHGEQKFTPEEFENRYSGTQVKGPFLGLFGKQTIEPVVENKKELQKLLEGRVHYVPEVSDTKPTVNEEEVPVRMSKLQAQLNKTLMNDAPFWVRWKIRHNLPPDKKQSTALNAFMGGMRQVALSPYRFDKRLNPLDSFKQSPKLIKAFDDTQKELAQPEGKVMVYSNFPSAGLLPFAAALDQAKIPYSMFTGEMSDAQRKVAVENYNSGRTRVVLIGPAGSEGLSLRGTRRALMLDPHWNDARGQQAEARAVRLDSHTHLPIQDRNVKVTRYVSEPPPGWLKRIFGGKAPIGADRYLYTRSAEKQKELETFLDLLREAGRKGTQ